MLNMVFTSPMIDVADSMVQWFPNFQKARRLVVAKPGSHVNRVEFLLPSRKNAERHVELMRLIPTWQGCRKNIYGSVMRKYNE